MINKIKIANNEIQTFDCDDKTCLKQAAIMIYKFEWDEQKLCLNHILFSF